MRFRSRSDTNSASPASEADLTANLSTPDYTANISDELLLQIFLRLQDSQLILNSLVCKRWLHLSGRLVHSLKLKDWSFVKSRRIFQRFPNLRILEAGCACSRMVKNSGILVTVKSFSGHASSNFSWMDYLTEERDLLSSILADSALEIVSELYPNLQRLATFGASESGLLSICANCDTLQELEIHCCGDAPLKGISRCMNLQVVKLAASVDGFYSSVVSDIGLTTLARGCRRLVKLELCGCEGSYDGIKAIGQYCQMIEELILCDHRMDGGWLAGLVFCRNLKTLKLYHCKTIDMNPGLLEHLGSCPAMEELHLQHCQLRERQGVKALFLVCEAIREIVLHNCWGLRDDIFSFSNVCRRVKHLSLEGCSLLTTGGIESVILRWKDLQRLSVASCNNVKDNEVTPALGSLFTILKELKWQPDSRSPLSSSLVGTGAGNKGGWFFRKS